MSTRLTFGQTLHSSVECLGEQHLRTTDQLLYSPGELVTAFATLYKHQPLEALSLNGSFVGTSSFELNEN